jgi:IS605 OrfB family transposase
MYKELIRRRQMSKEIEAVTTFTTAMRLKLFIIEKDYELKKNLWSKLRKLSSDSCKAANSIVDSMYLNDRIGEIFQARAGVRREYMRTVGRNIFKLESKLEKKYTDKDSYELRELYLEMDVMKSKISQAESLFEEIFSCKRQAGAERDLKLNSDIDLPSCISNRLVNDICSKYNKVKADIGKGKIGIPHYRNGDSFPVHKNSISFIDENTIQWNTGTWGTVYRFGIVYGRDKANNRGKVKSIISAEAIAEKLGETAKIWGAPSFQLKDNTLMIAIPMKNEVAKPVLDKKKIVGVDIGLAVPAYAAVLGGEARRYFLSAGSFNSMRAQLEDRKRRVQRDIVCDRGGHGRYCKLGRLEMLDKKQHNFICTAYHVISKQVVDFALSQNAGTVRLEMLEGIEKDQSKQFVLSRWAPRRLQRQIEMKAKRYGIAVEYVDPWHTSQQCSKCGNDQPGQRVSRERFVCMNCGASLHADYNAALNIANGKTVDCADDCTYKKLRQGMELVGPAAPSNLVASVA